MLPEPYNSMTDDDFHSKAQAIDFIKVHHNPPQPTPQLPPVPMPPRYYPLSEVPGSKMKRERFTAGVTNDDAE